VLSQCLESRCNRVLLVRSEGRVLGNVIGSGADEQSSVPLKLGP
jgi:hypothetical protein